MVQSLQPLPYGRSVQASRWCWSARTDCERAPRPDCQQRGLLTQYCSPTRTAHTTLGSPHPSLTHTATRDPPTDHAMLLEQRPAHRYLYQCCWSPSRTSKTLTSLRHRQSGCRSGHTVRHLHHLTYQLPCSTSHLSRAHSTSKCPDTGSSIIAV